MAGAVTWWDGERLSQREIALAVFARQPKPDSFSRVPLLGAAASGTVSVILPPTDFGRFLREHEAATLICYDAAELHWLLEGHFRQSNDTQSSKVLWAYSAYSRLIDIMLLDQHVRRCQGEDGTAASPLNRLVRRHAGVTLPDDQEIQQRVATAWREMATGRPPDGTVLELVSAVAAGILRAYQHLLAEAKKIADAVEEANRLPVVKPQLAKADEEAMRAQFKKLIENIPVPLSSSPDRAAEPENAGSDGSEESDLAEPRHCGPLGVGIDVQAAIAFGQPDRPSLQVDAHQIDELRHENDRRFKVASRQLHDDPAARLCFQWSQGQNHEWLVARGDDGLPLYHRNALKVWLRDVADRLCDVHNLPASVPLTQRGDLSFDPECWGVWAACNRSLRAWRDIEREARLDHHLSNVTSWRPEYSVVPVFRSREPDLAALHSLGVPIFQAGSGHVFVVGTFPLLKLYCFAAAYEGGRDVSRGRLAGHFLEDNDPVGKIAGELCVRVADEVALREEHGPEDEEHGPEDEEHGPEDASGSLPQSSFEAATDLFTELREHNPEKYWHWWQITHDLLETIPLGLPTSLLSVLMAEEYGWAGTSEVQMEQLRNVLKEHIIYELEDFLDDHILDRLARILGLSTWKSVDQFAEREHVETTDAALRNDLLRKRAGSPLWQFIRRAQTEGSAAKCLVDDEIVGKILGNWAWTPAGRLIGPAFWTDVRRRQIVFIADEVMKSVAYALVAHGFPLVAVTDSEFVLEMAENQATEALLEHVAGMVVDAELELLERFAASCRCARMDRWYPTPREM